MYETAIDLVLAMMASASTDKIKPIDWWTRARSALEAGAAAASSLGHMVSVMARKLQIDGALSDRTTHAIAGMKVDDFQSFRALCQREAIYVVALARLKKQGVDA